MNFGYKLSKSSVLDLDKADLSLAEELAKKEPSFLFCISCGSCTGTCSAGQFTELNLRRLQILVKRGETSDIKEIISRCMLCGKCQWVCPKGVNTRNILLTLNQIIHARKI